MASIVAASLQRSDHLALMGDVPFSAMEKAFGISKKLFHAPKLAFLPVVPTSTQS